MKKSGDNEHDDTDGGAKRLRGHEIFRHLHPGAVPSAGDGGEAHFLPFRTPTRGVE